MTSEPMLNRGQELLTMLKEDLDHIGAEDLHQLQRTWELKHRVWTSEACSGTRYTGRKRGGRGTTTEGIFRSWTMRSGMPSPRPATTRRLVNGR